MLQPSKAGCAISAKALPKRRARVAACLALAAFRSARPRKQPWRKFLTLSVKGLEPQTIAGDGNEPWNAIDDCTSWNACPRGISKSRQAHRHVQQRGRVRCQD